MDFEREMYWAVVEEASLAELSHGVTDIVEGGSVQHGPWEPAACSRHLLRWFDQGLVELYDMRERHLTNRPDIAGPPATRHGFTGLLPSDRTRQLLGREPGGRPPRRQDSLDNAPAVGRVVGTSQQHVMHPGPT